MNVEISINEFKFPLRRDKKYNSYCTGCSGETHFEHSVADCLQKLQTDNSMLKLELKELSERVSKLED